MKFIADLHIHSRFSRATSKANNIIALYKYSLIKGIDLLGTGDFTHPGWIKELEDFLMPDGNGLLDLKPEYKKEIANEFPDFGNRSMKFIFSVEISSIYKKNDKVRKVHNVILFPDFESVKKFNKKLDAIGNIRSDGRPILGLDSKILFEIALDVNPDTMFIPAHIWTPWFSLFGMRSGFDRMDECFEDLTNEIFAVETGLSSDPAMNWRFSELDRLNLVSNSDAHSPDNLAREANLFDTDMDYYKIRQALKDKKSNEFLGTIEFFPEEGKYHFDGHRNCNSRLTPKEAISNNLICPVCNKPITVGVLHRIEQLADRKEGFKPESAKDYKSIIPLKEIIGDAFSVNKKSKKVQGIYDKLIHSLNNELYILDEAPIEEIKKYSTDMIAEGVKRVRNNDVEIIPGYDGEYGKVVVFSEEDRVKNVSQFLFLSINSDKKPENTAVKKREEKKNNIKKELDKKNIRKIEPVDRKIEINKEQEDAIQELKGPIIVLAGPGTGKTFTLIQKIIFLNKERDFNSDNILAITFTNKAADEIKERLIKYDINDVNIGTFHCIALDILNKNNFNREIFDENDCQVILKEVFKELNINLNHKDVYNKIARIKGNFENNDNETDEFKRVYEIYHAKLDYYMGMDYEDIIIYCYRLLKKYPDILNKYKAQYKYILVDEFQDINYSEYSLIKLLSNEGKNLFVIGDADQSIYKFRGSNPELIYKLMDDFLYYKKVVLKKNYRNPESVIKFAVDIIKSSSKVIKKYEDIDILIKSDVNVDLIITPSWLSGGIQLAKTITKYIGGTSMLDGDMIGAGKDFTFKDFAILVRTSSQIAQLEETLLHEGIPYRIIGDKSILNTKLMRLAINILRLKIDHFNNFRFFNIIESEYFNISKKIINNLKEKLLLNPEIDLLKEISNIWNKNDNKDLDILHELLMSEVDKDMDPKKFFKKFNFTFFKEKEFKILLNMADRYISIKDFLRIILIGNEQDIEVDKKNLNKLKNIETVSILTIHSAKGLEFPVVFIYEPVEGIMTFLKKDFDIEEERRLFYVAVTRAKEKLIMITPKKIKEYGRIIKTEKSRFIQDISHGLLNIKEVKFDPKMEKDKDQLTLF